MYKLKEKEGYKKTYDVRLCRGKIFKANGELKDLNNKLEDYTDEFIKNSDDIDEAIAKKVRLEKRIKNKKEEITILKTELDDYEDLLQKHSTGELDDFYREKYDKKEEDKNIRREKKFEKKNKINTENRKVSQHFYQNNRKASSKDRYNQKQYDYHYRYFVKNSAKVPKFVTDNLKKMPNNKGYIWRGIWFYGALPIPKIKDKNGKLVDDMTLKMHEIVGKDTYIRYKDSDGKWTINKKEPYKAYNGNRNRKHGFSKSLKSNS